MNTNRNGKSQLKPGGAIGVKKGRIKNNGVWIRLALALLLARAITVLSVSTTWAQTYTVLHEFGQFQPQDPAAPMVLGTDGNYYGTTMYGGAYKQGSIYELTASGSLSTLYSFTGGGDGENPQSSLITGSDGNLYGTTPGVSFDLNSAGLSGTVYGTVFRVSYGGAFETMHTFTGGADGAYPQSGVIQASDGNFYGTAYGGNGHGYGTVFRLMASGSFATLYPFTGGTDGAFPEGGLVQAADGNLYGTTAYGGLHGNGTVFAISTSGSFASLFSFSAVDDGANPQASLAQGAGQELYGTAPTGGNGLFSITTSGSFSELGILPDVGDGILQQSGLVRASDGNFYGTGPAGYNTDDYLYGVLYKLTASGSVSTIYTFAGGADGSEPEAGLIQGGDGELYGATLAGGVSGAGTLFKATTSGSLTVLQELTATGGGETPLGGLVQGTDGDFYGTATFGGAYNAGEVFRTTASGTVSILHTFTGGSDGAYPRGELVQGTDGQFYGVTSGTNAGLPRSFGSGFLNDPGTIFKISTSGSVTTLHQFTGGADGAHPEAGLFLGNDGDFYGTTSTGGSGEGTVFRVTAGGSLTTLYAFSGHDGANPMGRVLQTGDGTLYGTTNAGGAHYAGTIFAINPGISFKTIYSFQGANDGANPQAGLLLGPDGGFYGTASSGGSKEVGTIFRLGPHGAFKTLYAFDGFEGAFPTARLILGSDGNIYGAADNLFQLTPDGAVSFLSYYYDAGTQGPLVEGTDNAFYGTFSSNYTLGGGIFKLDLHPVLVSGSAVVGGVAAIVSGLASAAASSGTIPVYFEYGTDTTYGMTTPVQYVSGVDGTNIYAPFSATISGLSLSTTYHYRMVASDAFGTVYGPDQSFTTLGYAPPTASNVQVISTSGNLKPIVINVLANVTDADLYPLSITGVTSASAGKAVITGTTVTYYPRVAFSNFSGTDSFTYTVSDGQGGVSTATVTISNPYYDGAGQYTGMVTGGDPYFYSGILGLLTVNLTRSGAFTATLGPPSSPFSFKGNFGANDYWFVLTPYEGLALTFTSGPGGGVINATVDDYRNSSVVTTALVREDFNAATNPCPYAGKYTLIIPPPPTITGTQATATATVTNGEITDVEVTNPGSGYIYPTHITVSASKGSGAILVPYIGQYEGSVLFVEDYAGGSNYPASGVEVTIDPPSAGLPQGTGYALMTVSDSGAVSVTGKLGDGVPISCASKVEANGDFPIFADVPNSAGKVFEGEFVSGTASFANVSGVSDCSGTLQWTRPSEGFYFEAPPPNGYGAISPYYQAGFSATVQVMGDRYGKPAAGTPALEFNIAPTGLAAFSLDGGNLESPIDHTLAVTLNNKVTVTDPDGDGLKLNISAANGLFSGSVLLDPSNKKPARFSGVLLQKENIGAGFFIGPDQTGDVSLTPQ